VCDVAAKGDGKRKREDDDEARRKQTVVIIHGMGEQRPMETLRSSVETVYQRDLSLTDDDKYRVNDPDLGWVNRVWVVPDEATGTVELRRVTTPENRNDIRTDFFEFYWADIMDGTPAELVMGWFRGILLRSPFRVPRRVPIWIAWIGLWVLTLLFFAGGIAMMEPQTGPFNRAVQAIVGFLGDLRIPLTVVFAALGAAILIARLLRTRPLSRVRLFLPAALFIAAAFVGYAVLSGIVDNPNPSGTVDNPKLWAAALSAAFAALIASVIVPYVGDVARFVQANPATVAKREAVRERGLNLLRSLHGKKRYNKEPVYDRIVIVAHSLGAIVAYDLLMHLWEEIGPNHKRAKRPSKAVQSALQDVDTFVKSTWCDESGQDKPPFDLETYREAQGRLFEALSESGQGWMISDFVTVGSPLVHTEFLISDSRERMSRDFEERLLASSPPRPDRPKKSMLYPKEGEGPFVHFAAPFAVVRWTNIYDYHWFPLFGDVVSGHLPPEFGPAIDDRRVAMRRAGWPPLLWRFVTHTLYWAWQRHYDPADPPPHISHLRKALALQGRPRIR
jgi:hypothetical protein